MAIDYDIRLIRATETDALRTMLYHAIYVPPGEDAPDPSILDQTELARIYRNWGRPGDLALVAVEHHHIYGAAWYRLFPASAPGYGFVAEDIPELAVAVEPASRGRGIGSALLRALVSRADSAGYPGISLSVDRRNPAVKLYDRLGFEVVKEGQSPTMLLRF